MSRVSLEPGLSTVVRVPGRWWGAEIDPETRYLDREPWNNSLPPAGTVRPLLYPYDQPSRFNTWLMPVPGWADGTWEAGLYGMTRAASSWSGGPWNLSGVWRQPLAGVRPGIFGLELESTTDRSRRSSGSMAFRAWMGYGQERVSLAVSRNMSGPFPSDPGMSLSIGASLESVSDASIPGVDDFSEGHGLLLSAMASRWSWSMSGVSTASVSLSGCPDWSGDGWASLAFEGSMSFSRLPGTPGTRLFAGRIWGDAPLQHQYRPGGGLNAGGVLGWLLPPDGDISATEHYFVESGPALPGYGDSPVHGRIGIGLGETVRIPVVPFTVFADAGWVENSAGDISLDGMLVNAGVGIDAGFVQAWFPAWVSDPLPGDDEWELRWRLAFSLWGLPMQLY
jgi:hypothetical protein